MSTKIYRKCQRNTHSKPESMPMLLLETVRLSVNECVKREQESVFLDLRFSQQTNEEGKMENGINNSGWVRRVSNPID